MSCIVATPSPSANTASLIRVQAGKTVDRHGKPLTIKLSGEVEAWFENPADGEATDASA